HRHRVPGPGREARPPAGADGDAQRLRRPGRHPGGADRRTVLPGPRGGVNHTGPVVVVGGGIAGLTAALELAESGAAVARLVAGVAVPRRRAGEENGRSGPGAPEETVAEFFTRRLGGEAYARVVEPLLAGIHAGDAARLSLPATFPRFVDMERDHGGLVRAALAGRAPKLLRRKGTRRPSGSGPVGPVPAGRTPFVSFQTGMAELIEALVARLASLGVDLRPNQAVATIRATGGGYEVVVDGGPALPAAAVVVATPAPVTTGLLRDLCPAAAALLEGVPHASTATVSLAYRAHDVGT